jgi:hypothetical protein
MGFHTISHLLLLLLVPVSTLASNIFFNPPRRGPDAYYTANQVWPIGSTQRIEWNVEFSSYPLILVQENADNDGARKLGTLVGTSTDEDQSILVFGVTDFSHQRCLPIRLEQDI